MVQISLQNSGGKVVFSWGSMEPPLGSNGSKSTLVTEVLRPVIWVTLRWFLFGVHPYQPTLDLAFFI